jgi:hypothetical protein
MRIHCSLCGVRMLDLDLCLSASVNVKYILHTQPLRFIQNKILVSVSLSIFVSIYLFWIIFLTFNTFFYHCGLSFHLP